MTPTDLVLMLPGWGTSPARLDVLSDTLQRAGAVARVWSYTPQGGFDELVHEVATIANSFLDLHNPADRLHLVGHSLGGLAAAAAVLQHLDGRVTSVTTINAPWRGTWVSYTGSGPLARALRWGSLELESLRTELHQHLEAPAGPRWLMLSAVADLATPATTALMGSRARPRLTRRVVRAAGHSTSLASMRIATAVTAHVLVPDGPEASGAPEWDPPATSR
jgi:pimeloyl-ACP methyl ester carboxylesterase